jgi:hypothetical protein
LIVVNGGFEAICKFNAICVGAIDGCLNDNSDSSGGMGDTLILGQHILGNDNLCACGIDKPM